MPEAVPGAAVSPGSSTCNLLTAPAITAVAGLVSGSLAPLVMSVAVTVQLPTVFKVTLAVRVPATNAPFAGKAALGSLDAMPTISTLVLTRFQLSSTALTTTLKAVPAVRVVGVPVLPVVVPGAAVSPGISTCSFVNAPTLTVMLGLVFAVLVPSLASVAVSVLATALRNVAPKICVPPLNVALAGSNALGSLQVMATVSSTVSTKFQLASTALAVTSNGVPAVCAVGVPVLPEVNPGAAVSPGTNNCSLTNAPGFTVNGELGMAVTAGAVALLALIVVVSALRNVVFKVVVDWPDANATEVT